MSDVLDTEGFCVGCSSEGLRCQVQLCAWQVHRQRSSRPVRVIFDFCLPVSYAAVSTSGGKMQSTKERTLAALCQNCKKFDFKWIAVRCPECGKADTNRR